jgi:hypothetical protein
MRPFEEFLERALRDFEDQVKRERLTENIRDQRLRGARDFAVFLLGQPMGDDGERRRSR